MRSITYFGTNRTGHHLIFPVAATGKNDRILFFPKFFIVDIQFYIPYAFLNFPLVVPDF